MKKGKRMTRCQNVVRITRKKVVLKVILEKNVMKTGNSVNKMGTENKAAKRKEKRRKEGERCNSSIFTVIYPINLVEREKDEYLCIRNLS